MHHSMVVNWVRGWKPKPFSAAVASATSAITPIERRVSDQPPATVRSIAMMATSSALGSRSNCAIAIQKPASPVSMVRLRNSARSGSEDCVDRRHASTGQPRQVNASRSSTGAAASCPTRAEPMPSMAAKNPSARMAQVYRTKCRTPESVLAERSGMTAAA